jgi:hypothetical protein
LERLRQIGIGSGEISLLTPETSEQELHSIRTSDTEQSGMGPAVGGVVGGAIGVATGVPLGAAAAAALIPGVAPVVAMGIIGAALLGTGGALAGAAFGQQVENALVAGIPADEVFFYEDALRQGRTVVIASAQDDQQAEAIRSVFQTAGAESLDAARQAWWVGLRDAELATYSGGDFRHDEATYRSGFEAALRPGMQGKSYEQALGHLQEQFPDLAAENAFRRGYGRGKEYRESLPHRDPRKGWIHG